MKRIECVVKNNIFYIGFGLSNPRSMTTLDEEILAELNQALDQIGRESNLKGVIFHSLLANCFVAGADIGLIDSMASESAATLGSEKGQELFNRIEDLKIPTIACVDGVCLGGGLELALSCKMILASSSDKTVLGLPEVKLGLLPGFGGTYRLPRKIGLPNALDLILTGKSLKADKAKRIGLVTEVYPKENLLRMAPGFLDKKDHGVSVGQMVKDFAQENILTKKIILQKVRDMTLKKTNGFYQAPLKIIEVLDHGLLKGRTSYLGLESQAFGELCMGEQSRNLRHIYFMSEAVKKYPGPHATDSEKNNPIPALQRGAALGAGTMGGGIAWLMADNDMNPIMKDLSVDALNLGLKQSSSNFAGALKRKKITAESFERKQRSISCQLDYSGFKNIDLVVEAVVENMEIKKKVFAEVEKEVGPKCLLTSNTSSLSIEEMKNALTDPSRFLGLHFFNPVHMMPLVEIIVHSKASPTAIEALYKWVLKTKKTPVIVKDGPGFLVNRILMPYLNEAGYLLEEGVSIKDIDAAAINFGMPMGPCRLLDEVGIDVGVKVAKVMYDGLGERAHPSSFSKKLMEKNFLGKKNAKGFYLYDEKGKVVSENGEVVNMLPSQTKKMSEEEIQKRLFLPMINEAATILDERIVDTASSVDLGLIFGIGFPPFRGGLLRYADQEGLAKILDTSVQMAKTVNADRYRPAAFLEKLVKENKTFYGERS